MIHITAVECGLLNDCRAKWPPASSWKFQPRVVTCPNDSLLYKKDRALNFVICLRNGNLIYFTLFLYFPSLWGRTFIPGLHAVYLGCIMTTGCGSGNTDLADLAQPSVFTASQRTYTHTPVTVCVGLVLIPHSYYVNWRNLRTNTPRAKFQQTRWSRKALLWAITHRIVVIHYRRFGTTYRSRLQGQGPISCPETSVRSYHYTLPLRKSSEERRSHILRGASLKLRLDVLVLLLVDPATYGHEPKWRLFQDYGNVGRKVYVSFNIHLDLWILTACERSRTYRNATSERTSVCNTSVVAL
jgi:hypothetical protein